MSWRSEPTRDARAPAGPGAFHVMAKPTGAACNLDCGYCFYLSRRDLYPGGSFRMASEVHRAYLAQLFAAHGPTDEVVVAFQGGEPTMMGLDFFRRTLEWEHRYRRPGQRVLNTLQTNGTLLDDEWGAFLAGNGFLVGLSVDGPRALHDTYRVDRGGHSTFDRVLRGVDVLRRHQVQWNVLTTVNAANGDAGRAVYAFLRDDLGARFIQFIPVVERTGVQATGRGDGVTAHTVGAQQYGRFLVDVFEEWVRHDAGEVFVQAFDTALAHWLGMPDAGLCVHARTCGAALALEHTGDLFPCDHYVTPEHLLGNIAAPGSTLAALARSPRQRAFGQAKLTSLPEQCRRCEVRFACNGGCPKDRFLTTPDGEPGLNYLCAGYRRFFRHVAGPMRTMAELVRGGRPPATIRAAYAAADARRGRNDPCPCGNGRKWKRCHGAPALGDGPVRGGCAGRPRGSRAG